MDEAVDIQIPDIEKEIDRLWKASQDKRQVKACLFTLVIFAHDERRKKYLQELVDTILDKFPCRIIFIQEEQSEKKYFHVTVSTVVSGGSETAKTSTVACDQISIVSSKNQLFRVPYLVTPHLVPDLPVYLVWGQNPFEEKVIFPHLQPFASRVIFDSECSDDVALFCKEMMANLNELSIDAMDINWALVSNWRDMICQLFNTPKEIEELTHCKSIIISYQHDKNETVKHPEIRSIYLQGWLASCLKWKYRATETFQENTIISYFGPIHPVVIALAPLSNREIHSGSIASIEIKFTNGNSYYIARKPNMSAVVVHASTPEECKIPFSLPLPNVHRGLTFMKEIFFNPLDKQYENMLRVISSIDFQLLKKDKNL